MNEKGMLGMKEPQMPLIEAFLQENEKIRCEMKDGLCSIQNKVFRLHNYSPNEPVNDQLSKEPNSFIDRLELVNYDLRKALQAIQYINDHLELITG